MPNSCAGTRTAPVRPTTSRQPRAMAHRALDAEIRIHRFSDCSEPNVPGPRWLSGHRGGGSLRIESLHRKVCTGEHQGRRLRMRNRLLATPAAAALVAANAFEVAQTREGG